VVTGLYYAHTGMRWLVILAIIVALGFMIYSLVTNREQDRFTRIVMVFFSASIGIQWVLGLLYYLIYAGAANDFGRGTWVAHLSTMTLAMLVSGLYAPARRRASTRTFYIACIGVLVVVTILIVLGVSFLGGVGRWSFSPQNPPLV